MSKAKLALVLATAAVLAFSVVAAVVTAEKKKEQSKPKVTLELIWQKEFPVGIVDVAFDKDREGLFCPSVIVTGGGAYSCKEIYFLDAEGKTSHKRVLTALDGIASARVSKNGRFAALLEPSGFDAEAQPLGKIQMINASGDVVFTSNGHGAIVWVSSLGKGLCTEALNGEVVYHFISEDAVVEMDAHLALVRPREIEWEKLELHEFSFEIGDRLVFLGMDSTDVPFMLYDLQQDRMYRSFTYSPASIAVVDGEHMLVFDRQGKLKKDVNLELRDARGIRSSPNGHFSAVLAPRLRSVGVIDMNSTKTHWMYRGRALNKRDRRFSRVDVSDYGAAVVSETRGSIYVFGQDGQLLHHQGLTGDQVVVSLDITGDARFLAITTNYLGEKNSVKAATRTYKIVENP